MSAGLRVGAPERATVPLALVSHASRLSQPYALAVFAWLEGEYGAARAGIFPSHKRIAAELGVSRSTIQRALSWLQTTRWVTVEPRLDDRGRRTTNVYVLHELPRNVPRDRPKNLERLRKENAAMERELGPPDPVDNPVLNDQEKAPLSGSVVCVSADAGVCVSADAEFLSLHNEELGPTQKAAVDSRCAPQAFAIAMADARSRIGLYPTGAAL
jgi:hypothetical protein